ncbi:hypothetical protein GcM1_236010 [Golovinomyces cichoracearum]|uniref:Uncharacterized protein n=1 Tax=Golovinomyces cichoracearum TaxID=62708 RepID=A0A420IK78_9PEZI|nr:hypothetical protein GcM1_236010 [Golovinomyces cichoracearum]
MNSDFKTHKLFTVELPEMIKSKVKASGPSSYAFRGYKYATTKAKIIENCLPQDICLDTGCTMSLIDEEFLIQQSPQAKVMSLVRAIPVSGIGKNVHYCDKFVRLTIFFPGETKIAAIEAEFHLFKNLAAKMLVGTDILASHGIIIDLNSGIAKTTSREDITISVSIHSKGSRTLSILKSAQNVNIIPGQYTRVPIPPQKNLPTNRDFLLEPYAAPRVAVYSHIVDHQKNEIQVYNPTSYPVKINKNTKLGLIVEFEFNGCFLAKPEPDSLTARTPRRGWKKFSSIDPLIHIFNADFSQNSDQEIIHP